MATKLTRSRPLIVIVGPTASGKTKLAIEIAQKWDGEIICADSRTVYKAMDIGTAKPTLREQQTIPHWGINSVEPGERFTVSDFKAYAMQKIAEIRSRKHVPILVGGTGLYVDSIIFDYSFTSPIDGNKRIQFEAMSLDELYNYSKTNNILLPENNKNKRYVIRAIERYGQTGGRRKIPIENTIIVGITTDKKILRSRIVKRAEQLFEDRVVDEAKKLGKKYGWDSEAMTGNIYPIARDFIKKSITYDEFIRRSVVSDWHLAKRQLTWLKRNTFIHWNTLGDARIYLDDQLANTL
jgi:tRNA dimethylallyltransferase